MVAGRRGDFRIQTFVVCWNGTVSNRQRSTVWLRMVPADVLFINRPQIGQFSVGFGFISPSPRDEQLARACSLRLQPTNLVSRRPDPRHLTPVAVSADLDPRRCAWSDRAQ